MAYQGIRPSDFVGSYSNILSIDTPLPHHSAVGGGSGFNGTQKAFKLQSNGIDVGASLESLIVVLGGVPQRPTTDFTYSDGVITFTTAPQANLTIDIRRLQSFSSDLAIENLGDIDLTLNNLTAGIVTATDRLGTGALTTTQRNALSSPTKGQLIFNETTASLEFYDGNSWVSIAAPPTVTSINNANPTETQIAAGFDIVITGEGFRSGAVVQFIGNDATVYTSPTVTFDSATQLTARIESSVSNANEPYDVKVVNLSGLSSTLEDAFNVNSKPVWSTSAGSLGTVIEGANANITVTATDPESDTIAYSETTSNLSGAGFSLNSSTGLISGTANSVSGDTTTSFTLRATSGGQTADRSFSIITGNLDGSTAARALQYGSEVITAQGAGFSAGKYWLTGKTSMGQTAQQVYIDADGWMLVYRHAGTGGSYNSTYEIRGDTLGEGAIGTLNSPTQGLTDSGSSTTAGSRGMARLSSTFCDALGGQSASGNVIRMYNNNNVVYMTDCKIWWTAASGGGDNYGTQTFSAGTSYADRRNGTNLTPDPNRPITVYNKGYGNGISYYHGNGYSGGYDGSSWHISTTIWIRQY